MSLPHPDLAIVSDHRHIICYKLPDISTLGAETHIPELRPLWLSQHPSPPDTSLNSGGYSFVSKPICSSLTFDLHIISRGTQQANISSRRIEHSVLRSSGTSPVRIIDTSFRLPSGARTAYPTTSNLLISLAGGSHEISFHVIPLDDVGTYGGRGTLRFDIDNPVGSRHSWVQVDFDETSGRAVVWWETTAHGSSSSDLAIVDLL
jgi:hypothetical protein